MKNTTIEEMKREIKRKKEQKMIEEIKDMNKEMLEKKNKQGLTRLAEATMRGETAIVNILIENGANLETRDNNKNTPIIYASQNPMTKENERLIKFLIQAKVKLNVENEQGMTPILYAIAQQSKKMTDVLTTNSDVNINYINKYGETPLIRAIKESTEDIIKMLVEKKGANVNDTRTAQTALQLAVSKKNNKRIVGILLNNAANPNQKNDIESSSVLRQAVLKQDAEMVHMLFKKNATIQSNDYLLHALLHSE